MAFPEPYDWEQLAGKNVWPDRVLFKADPVTGRLELYYIYDKGNNRGMTPEKTLFIRVLEGGGAKVFLQTSGNLMSLDEFNAGGGYRVKTTVTSRAYYYHMLADLKTIQTQIGLASSPEDKQRLEQIYDSKKASCDVLAAQFGKPNQPSAATQMPWAVRINRWTKFFEVEGKSKEEIHQLIHAAMQMKDAGKDHEEIEKEITNPHFVIGQGVLDEGSYLIAKMEEAAALDSSNHSASAPNADEKVG